jgi:hypothetical protein
MTMTVYRRLLCQKYFNPKGETMKESVYEKIHRQQTEKEVLIKPYLGYRLTEKHRYIPDSIWILRGCNDIGILYWSKPNRKKLFVIDNYMIPDIPELIEKGALKPVTKYKN